MKWGSDWRGVTARAAWYDKIFLTSHDAALLFDTVDGIDRMKLIAQQNTWHRCHFASRARKKNIENGLFKYCLIDYMSIEIAINFYEAR